MTKVAGMVALSIFFTCTLFFTVYGLAYFGIIGSIHLIKKVKEKIKDQDNHIDSLDSFLKRSNKSAKVIKDQR